MSYGAVLDGADAGQIATVTGWAEFTAWADGLDAGTYPETVHLADHAWSQNLDELESELWAAVSDSRPDADTLHVAHGLLRVLKHRDGAQVLAVTDGTGDGGDDPDDDGESLERGGQ